MPASSSHAAPPRPRATTHAAGEHTDARAGSGEERRIPSPRGARLVAGAGRATSGPRQPRALMSGERGGEELGGRGPDGSAGGGRFPGAVLVLVDSSSGHAERVEDGQKFQERRRTGCTPCCRGWQTWTTTTPCPVEIVVCDVRCPSSTPLLLRRRGLSRAKSPLPPPGPPPPSLGRCLWTTRRQRIARAVTMKGYISILVAPQLWARRARGTARFQGPPERLCGQAGNGACAAVFAASTSRRHPEARPACWVQRPANVRARP